MSILTQRTRLLPAACFLSASLLPCFPDTRAMKEQLNTCPSHKLGFSLISGTTSVTSGMETSMAATCLPWHRLH